MLRVWMKAKGSTLRTIKNKLKLKRSQIYKKPKRRLSRKKAANKYRNRYIMFSEDNKNPNK